MPLILEVSADGSGWRRAATLNPGDPEGSICDNRDDGRDVLMFRCEPRRSVIRRSSGGVDFEVGPERVIMPLGLEELAVLADGESFERDVTTGRGVSCRVGGRWCREQRDLPWPGNLHAVGKPLRVPRQQVWD